METSLHRQLKAMYAGVEAANEVRLDGFRIDAVRDGELIEIQLGSLAAIRAKIRRLLDTGYPVRIVKPIVIERRLVRLAARDGKVVHRRCSPKRETPLEIFHELVYFTRVFPHPLLTLETPHVAIEETRYPGHGKRRRWREKDFLIQDQTLLRIDRTATLATAADLIRLLPAKPPRQFHTAELAEALNLNRWVAQRVAYCLRECGATEVIGKTGNAWRYRVLPARRRKAA